MKAGSDHFDTATGRWRSVLGWLAACGWVLSCCALFVSLLGRPPEPPERMDLGPVSDRVTRAVGERPEGDSG